MAEVQTMLTAEMASNAGDTAKALQDLQGSVHFVIKKVRPSHVPSTRKKNCTLVRSSWLDRIVSLYFHSLLLMTYW